MPIPEEKIQELALKWLQGNASPEEEKLLFDWYNDHPSEEQTAFFTPGFADDELRDRMLANLIEQTNLSHSESRKRKINRFVWYSAAASVVLILAATFWLRSGTAVKSSATAPAPLSVATLNPGTNKAVLTLDDGKQVFLDEVGNGTVSQQKTIDIVKSGGQITYKGETAPGTTMYNSVATPRQGQYHLVLSDGTNVWLDAESSIRFPVSFDDTCRRVELTGQAYFEVAPNKQQPFIVHMPMNNSDVRVLGTHFNIMAYKNEPAVRTTLLEGAVRVNNIRGTVLLKPGEQAAIKNSNSPKAAITVQQADTERVMAWKNGMFHFGNTPIDEIMRQVARWYDADVQYKGSLTNLQFSGQVARTSNVSELLQLLEATGTVRFEVTGKNITVIAKE